VIAFVDSSVFLRALFREKDAFTEWKKVTKLYCSRLPIHLATAMTVRKREPKLVFVSHDTQQRVAARALALPIV
jgi:predicted nucleic acid-binding protein